MKEAGLGHLLAPWFDDVQDSIGKGAHILTTLSRARRLESSDSRDKIYAVLGVSSGVDLDNDRIGVDYNKTVEQVYTDFAQYLIHSTRSYDVLRYVGRRLLPLRIPAAPWNSWDADWRVPLGPQRMILSILEQEDDRYQVRLNHCWTRNTLSSVGRVIGRIVAPNPQPIRLSGLDESTLEAIRNTFRGDEAAMEREILQLWSAYPFGFSWNNYPSRDPKIDGPPLRPETHPKFRFKLPEEQHKPRKRGNIGPFFRRRKGKETVPSLPVSDPQSQTTNHSKTATKLSEQDPQSPPSSPSQPRQTTLEDLLLSRSRTTVHWSGDISGAVSLVVNESSVLEGRSLANFTQFNYDASSDEYTAADTTVALVPTNTRIRNVIVALKGGRVLFVVRAPEPSFGIVDDPVLPLIFCELVGECFVNGYEEFDSVFVPGVAENGRQDHEFVFGVVRRGIRRCRSRRIRTLMGIRILRVALRRVAWRTRGVCMR